MNPTNPFIQSPLGQPRHPEEVHLQDYINIIRRRRVAFAISFLAVFLGVALATFLMKPVYEASATLHVKDEKSKTGVLGELALSEVSPVDSEIEIVKSRTNAEEVVKRLHLDRQVTDKSPGFDARILEFSSTAKKLSCRVVLTGADTFAVKDDDGNVIGQGRAGVLMQAKGTTLLLADLKGKPGDGCTLALLPFNDKVAGLRNGIKAVEVGKKTGIIGISYASTDPARARDVVNTLVQAYLEKTIALKAEEASRTVDFVDDQIKGVRQDLDKSEADLQGYKSASQVVNLDSEADALIQKISEVETQRADANLQKKQMEFALASLKDAMRRGKVYAPALLRDDPLVAGMAGKLADLEVQKKSLRSEYTEAHPQVKAVQGQIDEVQRKLQATYETAIRNLTKQEASIAQRLSALEGQLRQLPATERDLARYTRLAKVNSDIYTFLLQKHEEARIAKASTISNIDIVDPAITPDRPIKPRKGKNLLLGLLVGCMLGAGLAFFQEYLDDTIKDAEEVKRLLGFPLLGLIPHIPHSEGGAEALAGALITHHDSKSAPAEAFRSLRTALHFAGAGRACKCTLMTSSFPGEGKTTISSNFAIIQAQTGARVVLVGCDLRRPSLHQMFNSERSPGLSEVLIGDCRLDSVIRSTNGVGIDYISAGVLPPNPAELLGSDRMREVVETLRGRYDHIIIDAPPMLAVADAQVLAPLADLVVVVIEAGRVPRKAGQRLRELLVATGAPVAGVVMNDKTGRASSYYGYYGYNYYGYGDYGEGEGADKGKKPLWKRLLGKG
ncbi:MAG TPA: polysaccharide biosynthesis tyrosine autokinase [Geobacteraceae bacterium]